MAADRTAAPVLEFVSVTRRYQDGARGSVTALSQCSFALGPGQCATIEGPSGSGKSTLLALACGLLLPTEGEVRFEGEPLSRSKESFRAQNRREKMGIVLQDLALVASMRVDENVLLATLLQGVDASTRTRMRQALKTFSIEALEHAPISTLSGGEKQRVALARAAMHAAPKLLVLDEPTARLDDTNTESVTQWLRTMLASGAALLIATHDSRLSTSIVGAQRYILSEHQLKPMVGLEQ